MATSAPTHVLVIFGITDDLAKVMTSRFIDALRADAPAPHEPWIPS